MVKLTETEREFLRLFWRHGRRECVPLTLTELRAASGRTGFSVGSVMSRLVKAGLAIRDYRGLPKGGYNYEAIYELTDLGKKAVEVLVQVAPPKVAVRKVAPPPSDTSSTTRTQPGIKPVSIPVAPWDTVPAEAAEMAADGWKPRGRETIKPASPKGTQRPAFGG